MIVAYWGVESKGNISNETHNSAIEILDMDIFQ